jgi:pimeloyl-[acyl-carrier protein] methyl ester esterase
MTLAIRSSGAGHPLVLFHGWGFDQLIWDSLTLEIKDQFQVYVVDLPGFGQSPLMPWPTFKERLLTILPKQFAVLGWSLGGLYATRLALEAESRVTHLINVASSPRFIRDDVWPGVESQVLKTFMADLLRDPDGVRSQFIALQSAQQPVSVNLNSFTSVEGLKAGLDVLANWDLREPLNQLDMPVCYMFGRLDAITPRQTIQVMQGQYPQFDYVLFKKAAHMPFLSHKADFVTELTRFLTT